MSEHTELLWMSTHDALLAACETLVDMEDRDNRGDPDYLFTDAGRVRAWEKARAAIALAQGDPLK